MFYSCLKQTVLEISFSFSKIDVSIQSPYSTVGFLLILERFEIEH